MDPLESNVQLEDFALLDPAIQQCPHAHYAKMRAEQPVFQTDVDGLAVYMVTRHEAVLNVLRDPQLFSSKFGRSGMPPSPELAQRIKAVYDDGWPRVPTMLTADAPEQTRFRKLVSKAFTPKAINSLEPVIREHSRALIDGFAADGSCEFVEAFAVPLPVRVIAKALNVPDERLVDFKRWSDDSVAGIGTDLSDDDRVAAERGIVEFQHYFAEQVEKRRANPQDDILTNLLNARIDREELAENPDLPDEPLVMAEILSILQQLLVAGNETTTKMLAEMVRLLAENPEWWSKVRADPALARSVVEESLRLSAPTQGMWRIATADTEIDGVAIPAGSRLVVMFASANRDDTVFADPEVFDPAREALSAQLAFGKGAHYCLGANLSRLEGRVALEELSARFASVSVLPDTDLTYLPSFMLRGLISLDVRFGVDDAR